MIDFLGDRGPAGEPEVGRDGSLVHLRAVGERGFLGVLRDDSAERLHVFQRPAHEQGIRHALAVVGEHAHPGLTARHRADFGQPLALEPHRDGADRPHRDVARRGAVREDLLDDAGVVGDRGGVGHRVHRGEAADRGRPGAAEHRFAVFESGLAQVGVQVDQAGEREQAVGVDDAGAGLGQPGAQLGDPAAGHQDVGARSVDEGCRADQKAGTHACLIPFAGEQEVQHCHPHRHPVRHLFAHCRPRRIGGSRGDLQTAIHRPWMHDHAIAGHARKSFVVEAPLPRVLPGVGEECRVHPLGLDAQHHQDVEVRGDRVVEAEAHGDRPLLGVLRQQGRRCDQVHAGAEGGEQPQVRARHPGVNDVAGDGDAHAVEGLARAPRRRAGACGW